MAYKEQTDKQRRAEIVRGARSHIKSILRGLAKFEKGSNVESGYISEHMETLEEYYLKKIYSYGRGN